MTRTGYILAKTLATFGIAPLEKYRAASAFEAHLLRDSETIIGELAWSELEGVEDVSAEYWKLRKLHKQELELDERIGELEEILETAQASRAQALEEVAEITADQVNERDKAAENVERLHQERDDIQRNGRALKRNHSGLKTKLEVLIEEHGNSENLLVQATKKELKEKRAQFDEIKRRRDAIDVRIAELQKRLVELNKIIEAENNNIREKAEEQFATIGKTNKELTSLYNKLGRIKIDKNRLCTEVGTFMIQNNKDPDVREALRKHRALISLINEVRASSNRHRKIVGN